MKGSSLIELLVAITLFGLVAAGFASVAGTAERFRSTDFKRGILEGQHAYALHRVAREVRTAVLVAYPAPGVSASKLAGGTGPLNLQVQPPVPSGWFVFCLDGSGRLWRQAGAGWPPPSVPCGSGPSAEILASQVEGVQFSRPASMAGLVATELALGRGLLKVRYRAEALALQDSRM